MRLRRFSPALVLVAAGCMASKQDVALLQSEIQAVRDATVRGDSARRLQVDQVLTQLVRSNDSVRAVSLRLGRLQADVSNDHHEMIRQIQQIQELSGLSQRRLQELRSSLEDRAPSAAAPAPAPGDAIRPPAAPGPGQLFQSSLDQLRRGSIGVARSGFEELLRTYPNSEDAPESLVYVGETYAAERNPVAADSVYGLVVQRYPKSPKAATALYKRALILKSAGQNAAARASLERIVREYPRSDEASLAREQLRTLGR
ncbi:MAG: tetratricopeptide repeat protein [Gemmatimonadaceae bacterium]